MHHSTDDATPDFGVVDEGIPEVPRPLPRPTPAEWVRRVLGWIGPHRLVAAAGLAGLGTVGAWWLLHAPPPRVERTLPVASSTATSTTPASGSMAPVGGTLPAPTVAGSAATPAPAVVVVHVAGAVTRPGLVTVAASARVADAIAAAGGATPDGDLDVLNLAAPVTDGTRIYVPEHGEAVPVAPSVGTSGGGTPTTPGPLDLNTATVDQLDTLPGVGPATAAAIVAYRDQHGPFRTVDDLLDVRGIGPAKLEQFRPLVTV